MNTIPIYSNFVLGALVAAVLLVLGFVIKFMLEERMYLIHKLYITLSLLLVAWLIAVIAMRFTTSNTLLYILDSITYLGVASTSVFGLLIAFTFVKNLEKMPKKYLWLFAVPVLINIMVWTNPWHHLYYTNFSIDIHEIEFGPFATINSIYSTIVTLYSIITMINFARKNTNQVYKTQAILFTAALVVPLIVNTMAVLRVVDMSIASTPLSCLVSIVCQGVAIYKYNFFDIKPVASEQVLNNISDCYLVVNENGIVISFNKPFAELFGRVYGIKENMYLKAAKESKDEATQSKVNNLLTAIENCKQSKATITYEASIVDTEQIDPKMLYYMVETSPLWIDERVHGFVIIFKDVTGVKESMARLEESYTRMMEQERLAALGQMVGGLAHNLKTPIMSISGSSAAMDNLVDEALVSLGDADVTKADYEEIYGEMHDWLMKIREACAYMSDIITAVKGQAGAVNVNNEELDFSLLDALKRVHLLLRHEFLNSGCTMEVQNTLDVDVLLHGDINNMVQVLTNIVSNAIDAQTQMHPGCIVVRIEKDAASLRILVIDNGPGVPNSVKNRLFKQMITNKGAKGTGLGVYISNSVIRGKFSGEMWVEDNATGGSVFGISIPLERVVFAEGTTGKGE